MRTLWITTCLLLAAAQAVGQPAPEARAADPAYRESVLRLMRLTGAARLGEQFAQSIAGSVVASLRQRNPDLSSDVVAEVEAAASEEYGGMLADDQTLLDFAAPLYARHFTRAELDELSAFYATELGQKTVRVMPAIQRESMQGVQEMAEKITPRFMQNVERRLTEKGLAVE